MKNYEVVRKNPPKECEDAAPETWFAVDDATFGNYRNVAVRVNDPETIDGTSTRMGTEVDWNTQCFPKVVGKYHIWASMRVDAEIDEGLAGQIGVYDVNGKKGIITHVAGNGACSIHDFELAYLGGTSEDVPTAIEDGSFGMWEQTGRWMNEAIQQGAAAGFGYGESLARYIDAHKERFPYREQCVLYKAWTFGIPATYHIALGTDIIHQHPIVDFGAIGVASGRDFHTMCNAIAQLDGGAYLNFGSAVIGPEVFLKALSISRNLGHPTFRITTADFDLKPLGDYRCKIGYEDPNYYYRPRKNIVNRPVSCGGKGWHFVGDHKETIANLWKKLVVDR